MIPLLPEAFPLPPFFFGCLASFCPTFFFYFYFDVIFPVLCFSLSQEFQPTVMVLSKKKRKSAYSSKVKKKKNDVHAVTLTNETY